MEKNIHVAIIGANGYVGKNLRAFLSKKNIDLVSIARKNFKTFKCEKKIISSNLSEKHLANSIRECSAVFNLVGSGKQNPKEDYNYVNYETTKKIIKLCKKSKIQKIIYFSGLGVSKSSTSSYFISKFKAENEIKKSGIDYTIFRPSYIVGNGDPLSKSIDKQAKSGQIIIPGSGNFDLQPIQINDVLEILYQAIFLQDYKMKTLDLVGPKIVKYRNFIQNLTKNKVKIKHIPLELAYFNAIHKNNWVFGIDDLNLLVGCFTGDFKQLQKISKLSFKKF